MFLETSDWIADILEEHFEETQALWELRLAVRRSPDWSPADLDKLDARIAAHVDGLAEAGLKSWPWIEKGLKGSERVAQFAAAAPLLAMRKPEMNAKLAAAIQKAAGQDLSGHCDALALLCPPEIAASLADWTRDRTPGLCGPAVWILALHKLNRDPDSTAFRLIDHELAGVRSMAWQILALSGKTALAQAGFETGFQDPDENVRRDAWEAAVWTSQPWLVDFSRKASHSNAIGRVESCETLALLGGPGELQWIAELLEDPQLGPNRPRIAARYAHPALLPRLADLAGGDDKPLAVAAGRAFSRITGHDVDSTGQFEFPLPDGAVPDEFEKEFLETATLPDAARARDLLASDSDRWKEATRWYRGLPDTGDSSASLIRSVDLESRWEIALRSAWQGNPLLELRDLIRPGSGL